jgi:thymidine phosphorylase
VQRDLAAPRAGFIAAMDTRAVGLVVVALGGGRRLAGDAIDARVGLSRVRPLGTPVQAGEPLLQVHAADEAAAAAALAALGRAIRIDDAAPAETPVVLEAIGV